MFQYCHLPPTNMCRRSYATRPVHETLGWCGVTFATMVSYVIQESQVIILSVFFKLIALILTDTSIFACSCHTKP